MFQAVQCLSAALIFGIRESLDAGLLSQGQHWLLILVKWEIRETKRQSMLKEFHLPSSHFEVQCPVFSSLKVGLSNHGHSPGAYIFCSLWDRAAEDVGCPSLAAEALVLSQTTAPDRGQGGEVIVLFFSLSHEAKITSPGEGQLRIPPLAKSNYKLYPPWNAIRGWFCFIWDANWQFLPVMYSGRHIY